MAVADRIEYGSPSSSANLKPRGESNMSACSEQELGIRSRLNSYDMPHGAPYRPRVNSFANAGLLPDPLPSIPTYTEVFTSPPVFNQTYTPEGVVYYALPTVTLRNGMVSPILSYGKLPVLSPPAPYPGYFVTPAPQATRVAAPEPRLDSKDDFPEISAVGVTARRKKEIHGKFPKKRNNSVV
jgi:hypothetical protein